MNPNLAGQRASPPSLPLFGAPAQKGGFPTPLPQTRNPKGGPCARFPSKESRVWPGKRGGGTPSRSPCSFFLLPLSLSLRPGLCIPVQKSSSRKAQGFPKQPTELAEFLPPPGKENGFLRRYCRASSPYSLEKAPVLFRCGGFFAFRAGATLALTNRSSLRSVLEPTGASITTHGKSQAGDRTKSRWWGWPVLCAPHRPPCCSGVGRALHPGVSRPRLRSRAS